MIAHDSAREIANNKGRFALTMPMDGDRNRARSGPLAIPGAAHKYSYYG